MHEDIKTYNKQQASNDQEICQALAQTIDEVLSEATSKIWHAHPVWFIDDNPIVGISKQKAGLSLMFWSGADFEEAGLKPGNGKFKDASVVYTAVEQINSEDLRSWLQKSRDIQWDYKNIVKRKGQLERLK